MARGQASLSACLIVRNEEVFLDHCLTSLHGLVDEVVVVDTGSTDASISIAERHQATLAHYSWNNDFAEARNVGLDLATGDWILYIDADETLVAQPEDFRIIDRDDAVAASVSFRPAHHLTCYQEYRLFRNRADLRFKSPIHETILPDIDTIRKHEGMVIVESGAHIDHHGYEGDLTHKHKRNHPMLLEAVKQDPERIYLWHALGDCELGLGNAKAAEQAFRRALALVRKYPYFPQNAMIYADLLALPQAQIQPGLGDLEALLAEAQRQHSDDPLIRWWLAQHRLRQGNAQVCRMLLEPLLAPQAAPQKTGALAWDRSLFGEKSQALMGNSWLMDSNFKAAEDCFNRALTAAPDNLEYRTKRDLARAQRAG